MTFVLVLAAVLAVTGLAVWLLFRRGLEMYALTQRGRPVSGRVVERRARHSRGTAGRHRRVKLAYERPDTGPRSRWMVVSRSEWETLVDGAAVDLVYLPDRPSVFALRSLVNQARAVRGLAPLP